ncbi:hypothetical protein [Synechococcus sp. PCC 7502]|uniref:hypothetical protein n=2 Tax=Synechococcus sp. PCC 7502 TaxID=1173263 RepID=UPI001AEFD696|nr:hypothetical protein [Synechococcus sp. PCC 7502]
MDTPPQAAGLFIFNNPSCYLIAEGKKSATKEKMQVAARKMNDEIIAIYCLCDDILRAMNHRGDRQQEMSDGEVMTTAIVATMYFCRNYERERKYLSDQPQTISS